MTPQQLKVLWGRSGGRCSKCKADVITESEAGKAYPLAEQAHMTARSSRGPRGKSKASAADREDASNYILLCPTCHTEVDTNLADWPVGRLRQLKIDHEAWVKQTDEQTSMTELNGIVEVVAVDTEVVEGVVIQSPTRMKHGTRVSVQAQNANQVTGVRIGRPPKGA